MAGRCCACVLAFVQLWQACGAPAPVLPDTTDPDFIQQCVAAHNRFRSAVTPPASNMLYMSWDPDLAKTAKAWARKCLFKHNTHLKVPGEAHPSFTPVGENLWSGSLAAFSVPEAIRSWHSEVSAYSYGSNSCAGVCGHYTQVVWAESYKVGCAVHFCPSLGHSAITNAAHFICNYGPAGNAPRQPYRSGAACSACSGEQCVEQLCRDASREQVISDSGWYPAWDRPACDEYCISTVALRLLLLWLAAVASWLLPRHCPVAPAALRTAQPS